MARGGYSVEVKAAALAALVAGQAAAEVAATFNVPAATVRSWKSRAGAAGVPVAGLVPQAERERIGELLLGYLEDVIRALRAQAALFADREWLAKQSAQDLAMLHGISVDKAIRLLEALERNDEDDAGAEAVDEAVRLLANVVPESTGAGV